jgi:hypothetical protein
MINRHDKYQPLFRQPKYPSDADNTMSAARNAGDTLES